ncbi:MAG: peptidase P60 [Robiginitomaculum sp.]|nr:MAG: peptidase P60 [Robiginitomaculum sp.]
MSIAPTRAMICDEALTWIGTPYLHQASAKHAGCDCLGLVRGVWRAFYGKEPIQLPSYSPDWAEINGAETLKHAADNCLSPIAFSQMQSGDVILFRMNVGAPAKHMAIMLDDVFIVHAYWGRSVTKSRLAPFWRSRRAYAYRFPNIRN